MRSRRVCGDCAHWRDDWESDAVDGRCTMGICNADVPDWALAAATPAPVAEGAPAPWQVPALRCADGCCAYLAGGAVVLRADDEDPECLR